MVNRVYLLMIFAAVTAGATVIACEWDYDTLQMERQRFPDALELITGKFLRHSEDFYQWRIKDRLRRLEEEPDNLALYDDLAVAYDKTGQHDKAIETILEKEKRKPGLYKTYANLGTFYIHKGELAEGVAHLKKAIEINPDAHFGREIYQQLLVEYVLSNNPDGGPPSLPLKFDEDGDPYSRNGFADFVLEARGTPTDAHQEEIKAATKGVLGMMKFGQHDSPVLLEALADLLRADGNQDAKQLAVRAYLKASYEADGEEAQAAYRELAEEAILMQTRGPNNNNQMRLEDLEAAFQLELAEADKWHAEVKADELNWIENSPDPDQAFSDKYYQQPVVTPTTATGARGVSVATPQVAFFRWAALVGAGALLIIIAVVVTGVATTRKPSRG